MHKPSLTIPDYSSGTKSALRKPGSTITLGGGCYSASGSLFVHSFFNISSAHVNGRFGRTSSPTRKRNHTTAAVCALLHAAPTRKAIARASARCVSFFSPVLSSPFRPPCVSSACCTCQRSTIGCLLILRVFRPIKSNQDERGVLGVQALLKAPREGRQGVRLLQAAGLEEQHYLRWPRQRFQRRRLGWLIDSEGRRFPGFASGRQRKNAEALM